MTFDDTSDEADDASHFGTEIKTLRERKGLSGKDLADLVGLSQSQMSRLESGQRRVDAGLLSRLARALTVHPSYFFRDFESTRENGPQAAQNLNLEDSREPSDSPDQITEQITDQTVDQISDTGDSSTSGADSREPIGKIIRKERRRQHWTAEDLARALDKSKRWVMDLESGATELLTGEMAQRISKALKLDIRFFFEAQRQAHRELQERLQRAEQILAERSAAPPLAPPTPDGRLEVPLFGVLREGLELGADGRLRGEPSSAIALPELLSRAAFAITCSGDEMQCSAAPSFADGDILIFGYEREVRHRDLALIITNSNEALFRQVFYEPRGIRLQPRNLDYPPRMLQRDEVRASFRLLSRLEKF